MGTPSPLVPPPLPSTPVAIDYASPRRDKSRAHDGLYWIAFVCCVVTLFGLLVCFGNLMIAPTGGWALAAFYSLLGGGLLSFCALVLAIIYAVLSHGAGFPVHSRHRSKIVITWPIVNGVIASVLVVIVYLMFYQNLPTAPPPPRVVRPAPAATPVARSYTTVDVTLTGGRDIIIDSIDVVMPNRTTWRASPIAGADISIRNVSLYGTGMVELKFRSGQTTWKQSAFPINNSSFPEPTVRVAIMPQAGDPSRLHQRPCVRNLVIKWLDPKTLARRQVSIYEDGRTRWEGINMAAVDRRAAREGEQTRPKIDRLGWGPTLSADQLSSLANELSAWTIWGQQADADALGGPTITITGNVTNKRVTLSGGTNSVRPAWALYERLEDMAGLDRR